MVFISRGRGRGGNRGRGRGVGEVAFESPRPHSQTTGRDSRQAPPESLRITVGNDQFRDRKEDNVSGRLSPSVSHRLGPPKESYDHGREAGLRREDDMYRREADLYGHPDRDRFEREREYDRRDPYNRGPFSRPEERDYGDRRGLGGGGYEQQPPADFRAQPSQPLFPSASRPSPQRGFPPPQPAAPSPAQTSSSSRPLKSILKKKPDPVPEQKSQGKPSGLPGIANYMDDIEDEDKFLYGGEDDRRNMGERDRRESGQYMQQAHGVAVEDMRATNMRSAAQSWQPLAPEKTVSGVVSEFVNAQREYVDNSKAHQYGGGDPYHSQHMQSAAPGADGGSNDLWSMLAKSVQTAQQQQAPINQFEPQLGSYQPPFSTQSVQQTFPAQPVQEAAAPAASHDPTIENILKSIGFDFEMSKRMQEKAKQGSGEVVPQAAKPGDPKFLNQTASFIGSQMSHEEMISTLGTIQRERQTQANVVERQPEPVRDDFRDRDMFSDRDRRGGSEASRGRMNSPPRRMNSPPRQLNSPPRGKSPEELQRGCSPISAEGSPPPPMFNLPPITIKRRTNLDRSRSPGWDKKRSLSRSPTRDSDRSRQRLRSRSPSWNRSLSSHGRKRSRSPVRKQTLSPISPASQRGHSPSGRKSPIIRRTFNLDDLNPAFRRRVSPSARKRSASPGRRRSPGRRSMSPGRRRSISPGRRHSRSPGRRNSPHGRRSSRSPVRKRSRSPRRHSPSPRGRRRSLSPRGRKRGPSRSRSRERKLRRSTSRDRSYRGRRSSSRDRGRRRSRSRSQGRNRRNSNNGGRSLSSSSDSDIDGPANKKYFSSPLRIPYDQRKKIPRYYDYPPQQQGPPPDFNTQPFPGYGPGPGPPPGTFPPGSQPMMVPLGPGPPVFNMPPPGMGPPVGPPPGFPFPPPGGPPGGVYAMPGPVISQPPPPITQEPDMAPPGTVEMPLNLPARSSLTEIVSDDSLDTHKKESEHASEDTRRERSRSRDKRERSRSRERRKRSRSKDRRERSRSRDRRDRSRSRERRERSRSKERRERSRSKERNRENSVSSSNRVVLPPKPRSKAQDIEIKASVTSNERVVVMGGKSTKLPSKEEKKEDAESDKKKILKEKEGMVAKIKALETEFDNLKKQEFDLRKRSGKDSKPDPILMENKKLLEEIRKEIVKLTKQKNDFETKHSALLKKDPSTKREVKVTPKKTPAKIEKGKAGEKKEKEEFKVEKGKLMKHYFHDGGDHWCKPCNTIHPNIQDYMHHLASYKHKQTLPSDFRPWMDGYKANDGMIINKKGIRVPLPGIEFMMPVTAYYCELCKVFLGDVSFGADHFKCESHYINYKKYLSENPIYEKKYKEEREKVLSASRASKKDEQAKNKVKSKEQTKKSNNEKDARVRANEKKWEKSVDDLDDVSGGSKKEDTNKKSQIKLSLKNQNQKNEKGEKGFGKFNWTKDKKAEESKDGEKTPEASQEKDKGKINFNISLSGNKTIIGKSGAQKKNPLLPPWQPVGKKTETHGKPGDTTNLDQFLTTNSGEGKVPVITEKKKISAKEILEAFSGKYKDKEVPTVLNEADQAKASAEKISDNSETAAEKNESKPEVIESQEQSLKTKKAKKEEKDKRMMGIDPDSETPLAEKKPPPPVSQNVPLPDQKPMATVDENDVHKVFNSEVPNDSEKPIIEIIPLPDQKPMETVDENDVHNVFKAETSNETEKPVIEIIPLPDQTPMETVDASDVLKVFNSEAPNNTEKPIIEIIPLPDQKPMETVEENDVHKDIISEKTNETEKPAIEIITVPEIPMSLLFKEESSSKQEQEMKIEDYESYSSEQIAEFSDSKVMDASFAGLIDTKLMEVETDVSDKTVNLRLESKGSEVVEVPEAKAIVTSEMKEEQKEIKIEKTENEIEMTDLKPDFKTESSDPETTKQEVITVNEAKDIVKSDKESVPMKIENKDEILEHNPETVGAVTENVPDVKSEESDTTATEEDSNKIDTKSYDSDTEVDEPVSPVPTRGRGRGRGRKRGRGRGRGKAKSTPKRATRATRSTKSESVPDNPVEASELNKSDSDNIDNSETNKDLESNSSVQVGKTTGGKPKKSSSPRIRKTSLKSDTANPDLEDELDIDDSKSDASGISMHMDSDFEVVDDLEDMDTLDETL